MILHIWRWLVLITKDGVHQRNKIELKPQRGGINKAIREWGSNSTQTHPQQRSTRSSIRELLAAATEHIPPLVMVWKRAAAFNFPAAYPAPFGVALRAFHVIAALALLRRYFAGGAGLGVHRDCF
jgi:hypothetical protein